MKGKVYLYYNQITIGLQLGYNQLHHRLHRGRTQYKQFRQKKKKRETTKEKDRMKGRRRKGKRKKGKR